MVREGLHDFPGCPSLFRVKHRREPVRHQDRLHLLLPRQPHRVFLALASIVSSCLYLNRFNESNVRSRCPPLAVATAAVPGPVRPLLQRSPPQPWDSHLVPGLVVVVAVAPAVAALLSSLSSISCANPVPHPGSPAPLDASSYYRCFPTVPSFVPWRPSSSYPGTSGRPSLSAGRRAIVP
jgi:hypothetical protein